MDDRHCSYNRRRAAAILIAWLLGLLAISAGTGLIVQLAYAFNGGNIGEALQIGALFMASAVGAIQVLRRYAQRK